MTMLIQIFLTKFGALVTTEPSLQHASCSKCDPVEEEDASVLL